MVSFTEFPQLNGEKMSILSQFKTTLVSLFAGVLLTACFSSQDANESVSLEQAKEMLEAKSALVIDVRETEEHQRGVAAGMQLLPLSQLAQRVNEIPKSSDKTILLICNTQNRSPKAQQILKENGYQNVKWVQGGMSEWSRRSWPMTKP
jgi:rhodanese-related sulfurtransferase